MGSGRNVLKFLELDDLKDYLSVRLFGMTRKEARERGICVNCRKAVSQIEFSSELRRSEYRASGLCPECFMMVIKSCGKGGGDDRSKD